MTSFICVVAVKLTTYKETERFLFKQLPMYQRIGPKTFKIDLKNIKALSKLTGDPHKSFKSIHIAGTNGKGSTSYFVASLLSELGYKVGLYTSPHYKDYRERIKINGRYVSKTFVKSFVNELIEKGLFNSALKPSFFEISVIMAFEYFKQEEVDFAVIETGLGGRLDSTNIIIPEISLITNIGLDHTSFLGNTLQKIAREKAGIIKKNIPVLIGRTQSETKPIFIKKAKKVSAPISFVSRMRIDIPASILKDFPAYQKENMRTALAGLKKIGIVPNERQIKKAWRTGLKQWGFLGRYMKVSKRPLEIYDSAHNQDGLNILFKELKSEEYKSAHIVLAVVSDKDLKKVLNLFPKDAQYYFAQATIPRAMPKETLKAEALKYGLKGKSYSSIRKALAAARIKGRPQDLILVTGSIFTVAEVC